MWATLLWVANVLSECLCNFLYVQLKLKEVSVLEVLTLIPQHLLFRQQSSLLGRYTAGQQVSKFVGGGSSSSCNSSTKSTSTPPVLSRQLLSTAPRLQAPQLLLGSKLRCSSSAPNFATVASRLLFLVIMTAPGFVRMATVDSPQLNKASWRVLTCNGLDLKILGSRLFCPEQIGLENTGISTSNA